MSAQAGQSANQTSDQIKPFWDKINLFFLFPFQMEPLLYLLGLSLAGLLVNVLVFVPRPFDYLLVITGISLAATRYGFKVMQQASEGQFDSKQFPNGLGEDLVSMPWKLFGVMFLLSLAQRLLTYLFPPLDWLISLGVSVALPAAVATLLLTSSVWQAVTPLFWLPLVGAMGWSYLVLCFFLFLLSLGAVIAAPLFIGVVGIGLAFPVLIFCVIYFGWVMCSLLGYVIFQHHQALGYEPRHVVASESGDKGLSDAAQKRHHQAQEEAHYAELLAQGDVRTAREQAYEAQRLAPEDVVVQKRYHQILLLDDNLPRLMDHAQGFMALLSRRKQYREAIDVWQACRSKNPEFWPEQATVVIEMGQFALRAHDAALCIRLINGFDKKYVADSAIPVAYELAARALLQSGAGVEKIKRIAHTLQQRYPNHASTQEVAWLIRSP